jgi:hypothetical protein
MRERQKVVESRGKSRGHPLIAFFLGAFHECAISNMERGETGLRENGGPYFQNPGFSFDRPLIQQREIQAGVLFGHDAADAGAFHEAVEDDEESFLVFVGELIDFLIEPVQFWVVNLSFPVGVLPCGKFIEADIKMGKRRLVIVSLPEANR